MITGFANIEATRGGASRHAGRTMSPATDCRPGYWSCSTNCRATVSGVMWLYQRSHSAVDIFGSGGIQSLFILFLKVAWIYLICYFHSLPFEEGAGEKGKGGSLANRDASRSHSRYMSEYVLTSFSHRFQIPRVFLNNCLIDLIIQSFGL